MDCMLRWMNWQVFFFKDPWHRSHSTVRGRRRIELHMNGVASPTRTSSRRVESVLSKYACTIWQPRSKDCDRGIDSIRLLHRKYQESPASWWASCPNMRPHETSCSDGLLIKMLGSPRIEDSPLCDYHIDASHGPMESSIPASKQFEHKNKQPADVTTVTSVRRCFQEG